MAGSNFGEILRISTWGESHGAAVGAVIDGCPSGLDINEEYVQGFLNRRRPGQSAFTTQRSEADAVNIMSGVYEGKTLGTPISMMVENQSQISKDYSDLENIYRPGHADYGFQMKYGIRDHRGGGRSSGRETIGRVMGGAVAEKILEKLGVSFTAYVSKIGNVEIDRSRFDKNEIMRNSLFMPDCIAAAEAEAYLSDLIEKKDSSGAEVECIVTGLKPGIGEPVFDKLDARIAGAVMSIGGVKAVEIGDGCAVSSAVGSANNDKFRMSDGAVTKETNHAGGILGGMSDGSDIIVRVSFKPTPSIYQRQNTVTKDGEDTEIEIHGRHDPIIAPRAVVVVESMIALAIADLYMLNSVSRMDRLTDIYSK